MRARDLSAAPYAACFVSSGATPKNNPIIQSYLGKRQQKAAQDGRKSEAHADIMNYLCRGLLAKLDAGKPVCGQPYKLDVTCSAKRRKEGSLCKCHPSNVNKVFSDVKKSCQGLSGTAAKQCLAKLGDIVGRAKYHAKNALDGLAAKLPKLGRRLQVVSKVTDNATTMIKGCEHGKGYVTGRIHCNSTKATKWYPRRPYVASDLLAVMDMCTTPCMEHSWGTQAPHAGSHPGKMPVLLRVLMSRISAGGCRAVLLVGFLLR